MGRKSGNNGFVDAAVVVLAILLFFRTADVLTHFAPPLASQILGADASWLYAILMAFWIEGVALAFHFDKRAHNHTPANITKWILLGISALCQVYDGQIVTDSISQMSGPMKIGFQWGVPLLPIFVVILLFWVGKLPDGEGDGRSWIDRIQDRGIASRLPNPKAVWRGRDSVPPRVEEQIEEIVEHGPNGEKSDTANPIKAGRK